MNSFKYSFKLALKLRGQRPDSWSKKQCSCTLPNMILEITQSLVHEYIVHELTLLSNSMSAFVRNKYPDNDTPILRRMPLQSFLTNISSIAILWCFTLYSLVLDISIVRPTNYWMTYQWNLHGQLSNVQVFTNFIDVFISYWLWKTSQHSPTWMWVAVLMPPL